MISKQSLVIANMISNKCFVNQLLIGKLKKNVGFGTIRKLGEKSQEILKDFDKFIDVDLKSYLDIVNVQRVDLKAVSPKMIDERGDVLYLDMNLSSLKPDKRYLKLMSSIGIKKEKCQADVQGFNVVIREDNQKTIYPVIVGGGYNPYIKYKSNRASSSRRIRSIDIFSKLLGPKKDINLCNLNLTFPKELSDHLFSLKNKKDDELCRKSLRDFMKSHFPNVGYWANLHKWGSRDPFNPHYHFHIYFMNYSYLRNNFRKINFRQSKQKLKSFRDGWNKILKQNFNIKYNQDVNIWYQYFGAYNIANEDNKKVRCEMLHLLKYANRSYLIDVAKYFEVNDTIQDEKEFEFCMSWYKKQFKNFVSRGCIQNQTTTNGYLHNLKRIVLDNDKNNMYYECYQSKDRLTFNCPVTGKKEISAQRTFVERLNLTENLSVYMSYKTKVVKLAEFHVKKVIEKPLNKNQKQLLVKKNDT